MSILMPTSWYWKDVIGMTPWPPIDCVVLTVVTGIGIRSPIVSCAFSPSAILRCGLDRTSASVLFLMKLKEIVGMEKAKSESPILKRSPHGRLPIGPVVGGAVPTPGTNPVREAVVV